MTNFLKRHPVWSGLAGTILVVGSVSSFADTPQKASVLDAPSPVIERPNLAAPAPDPVPVTRDTDHDGLSDARKFDLGTSPSKSDIDNDGLTDAEETLLGTDPLQEDTDGDGFDDKTEVSNRYDPLSAPVVKEKKPAVVVTPQTVQQVAPAPIQPVQIQSPSNLSNINS